MSPFNLFVAPRAGVPGSEQQSRCPDCSTPLDGTTPHAEGCPYLQQLAQAMRPMTLAEMSARSSAGAMNAATWRAMQPEPEVRWEIRPRPGLWGCVLRAIGHGAGWITAYWPERRKEN